MTDSASNTAPGGVDNGQAVRLGSVVHRTVHVKGIGGVSATIVVTAQRGQVWMSIRPPFTWEAIMEPEKVGELVRTLAMATDSATEMVRTVRL